MLNNLKHFLDGKNIWKLTLTLVFFLFLGVQDSKSAKISKGDSARLANVQVQIESFHQDNNHLELALSYIQKAKLEKEILRDTNQSFTSIRNALKSAKKTNDINLEFYCLYNLRNAQYLSNVPNQKATALDTVLKTILDNNVIVDSLKFNIHQLWGNIYVKYNYHILALNEYLVSQNIAYTLKDDSKIANNLIHLLQIYNILEDDNSFKETQSLIEAYLPEGDKELKIRYYLKLRSFEYRYSQVQSESYLQKVLELSSNTRKFDFPIKKELAIYYLQNQKNDSALSTIEYLENTYLIKHPLKHLYAQIHIEDLYARFYYRMDDFPEAEKHYTKALELCDKMESPFLKRKLLLLTLKITKGLDDYELAFNSLRSLKQLEDSTINRSQIVEYQKLKTQLNNEQISKKIINLEYDRKIADLNLRDKNKNIIWLSTATIALIAMLLAFVFGYNQKRKRSKELQALNNLKDFVFSVISHDIRAPLYNFNTLLQMAENKYVKEGEYSEYLKTIQSEVQGITSVTESLLRWAKSNQGLLKINLSQFSLMEVLVEVKDLFKTELVERNIHIILNFLYDFEIKTDKDLFTFILRNIVQNAIKFSENDSQIEINAKKENQSVIIEVVDHGVGMDEEQLKNINSQISNPSSDISGAKSTGLGLIITRDFVKRLNIKNEVKSEVGKGTSISLSFELSPKD